MISRVGLVVLVVTGAFGCNQPPLPAVENPALTAGDGEVLRIVIESAVRDRLVASTDRAKGRRALVMSPTRLIVLSRDADGRPDFPPPPPPLFRGLDANASASSLRSFPAIDEERLAPAEIAAWRSTNRRARVIPDLGVAGFETVEAIAQPESAITVTLTAPAYPTATSALVYAAFHCGDTCGEGWLVRLIYTQVGWVVSSRDRLWIS